MILLAFNTTQNIALLLVKLGYFFPQQTDVAISVMATVAPPSDYVYTNDVD